ncbi:hypothetical protein BCV69DRAFT_3576 [Microstroma glucosiphilum]|uniref:Uncharacterized protein n=1 Tax=Pseudomicrostroma glucosiphilum TaxID=1684307 RepID=A0A316UF68_9BASI|nr:hypothetical protein BCV69DRAFT_3576 [Pseudomicrostroma glucosiphilum]PWN23578.1 hypothetical protein BCV69DRAFT_3576 [Pseudomicrostroma glucosiphilum]
MRRPSLVYSPSSSRTSSRSSSPPTSSYFSSLTPLHSLPSSPPRRTTRSIQQLLRIFTFHLSLASAAHYLCLLLSLRLLLRSPRLITLALTLTLVLSLEGRARAERLGLRNTMGGILGGVGLGLAGWTMRETALERHWQWGWRARQEEREEDASLGAADYLSRRLCQGAKIDLPGGSGDDLEVSICSLGAGLGETTLAKPQTDEADRSELHLRLSEAAAVYTKGEFVSKEVKIGDAGLSLEGVCQTNSGCREFPAHHRRVCGLAGQLWAADGGVSPAIVVVIRNDVDGSSIALACAT